MKAFHCHRAAPTPVEAARAVAPALAGAEVAALVGAEVASLVGAGAVDHSIEAPLPRGEESRRARPRVR